MAGSALLTPSVVLGALRYGETSRIVRLATRESGVVSAIAKGAMRPRSRFGASLQLLSEGQAHLLYSRSGDLHTLTAFDVAATHAGLARNLDRFAAASALAEIAARFVPPMPNPAAYDILIDDLKLLELAPEEAIPVVALRAMWRLIEELGLAPIVQRCARDGAALPEGTIAFSLRDGGFLCARCNQLGASTHLVPRDRADFVALLTPESDLPLLDPLQVAAHRRLLLRWVREHLGDATLPALESWAAAALER